jgi:hypothetical protein
MTGILKRETGKMPLDTPPSMIYHRAKLAMTRGAFSFSYFWFYGYFAAGKSSLLPRESTKGMTS